MQVCSCKLHGCQDAATTGAAGVAASFGNDALHKMDDMLREESVFNMKQSQDTSQEVKNLVKIGLPNYFQSGNNRKVKKK